MRTVAIAAQKGGVGKTTTTVNLAAALAESSLRVLVLDLDPQSSASAWLGACDAGDGLRHALVNQTPLEGLARSTPTPGIDLIAASSLLIGADAALSGSIGRETILRSLLRDLPPRWDVLLIDCPPNLGFFSISALTAVQEVLLTVEPTSMAVAGLTEILGSIGQIRQTGLNPELAIGGILLCRVQGRRILTQEIAADLRVSFGRIVLATEIRENVRLAEAPAFQKPINSYAPESSGTIDYRALAGELFGRWKQDAGGKKQRMRREKDYAHG